MEEGKLPSDGDPDALCPSPSSFELEDPSPPGDTGGAGLEAGEDEGHHAPQPLPAEAATMLRAKLLARIAMDDLRPENCTSRQSSASHVQKLREEWQAARSRIQANVSSVSKVFEITRSLESYILSLEDSKNRVKQKRNARWSDLEVCQKRLEILSKLDWFHDKANKVSSGKSGKTGSKSNSNTRGTLVEALEFEQEALLVQRRELGSLLSELDPIIETTIDLRRRLKQEASERRASMRRDRTTLTQQDSEREDQESSGLRSLDSRNFWVKKAQSLEDSAQQLLQKAISTLQWTDLECGEANQLVSQSLARCSAEDHRLRRQLDAQLRDIDFAISCADWTINKPENRHAEASAQVQRAHVLLHELTGTKKHLKCLVRKCKKDLQTLESCRNTTPHTLASLTRKKPEKLEKQDKDEKKEKPDELPETQEPTEREVPQFAKSDGDRSARCVLDDLNELRQLQAEERRLRASLQSYETRFERCAQWAELLTDLEERVAEALSDTIEGGVEQMG